MDGLVEGRIVHFVLNNHLDETDLLVIIENLTCRPAIIVNAWGGKLEDGMVNLQVFLDGSNDHKLAEKLLRKELIVDNYQVNFGHLWATSVKYSETKEIGTWHWSERN